jgi:hypothetical protein
MGAPLYDITVYYDGTAIKDAPEDSEFRTTVNFICDFYHQLLRGYKPPNTSRICIHLNPIQSFTPGYFGSICSIPSTIDEHKFNRLNKQGQLEYLLHIVHEACLKAAGIFGWEKSVFENANKELRYLKFIFSFSYPTKLSRDRKKAAHVLIEKTLTTSCLSVIITNGENKEKVKLISKRNWFWYDSIYEFAKGAKWLDNTTFGVASKRRNKHAYYSITDKVVIGDLLFKDDDF